MVSVCALAAMAGAASAQMAALDAGQAAVVTRKTLVAAAPPPMAVTADVPAEVREAALAALSLSDARLLILPVDFTPGRPISVGLPTDSGVVAVDLMPFSVRSDRFALFEQRDGGEVVQVKAPPENTLRGTVRGVEGSIVAGGVMPDGLAARIIVSDEIEYWIEPVSARVPGAPEGLHAVYTRGDLLENQQWRCGGPELREQNPDEQMNIPPQGMDVRGATLWTAVMDADADWEFYLRYGGTSAVIGRIQLVTNTMNIQYERDVNIRHTVGTVVVRATSADPYTTTDPATFNAQIETEWSSGNRPGTSDVVQMFTGKELNGSTIGRANHIGSICLDGDSNCLSQSDYNGNFMSATDLSAHELGHLWDAVHCSCSGPVSTMNPVITSINRFTFSNDQNTISQINSYRASRGCLSTSSPGTAAPNDVCWEAEALGPGLIGFSNDNADTDGPTPTTCGSGNNFQEDVWYTFTAPCDGLMSIDTCGSNFDTVLAVYTGSCGSLTQVGCNDDSPICGGLQSAIANMPMTFGTVYRIRLGGFSGANGQGLVNLVTSACPPPSNNNCGAAITIDQCAPVAFSTIGATTDGPIEPALCNSFSFQGVGSDVWYRYVAPCAGTVRVSLCGSGYDTKLAVYNSCPGGPDQAIACNDDWCGLQSQVEFAASAGSDYYFRVGGYNNQQGVGTLQVTNLGCAVANDTCATAQNVATGSTPFSTVGACSDGFTSTQCLNDGGNIPRDVWFRWTAPACGGQVTIDTCPNSFDTKLAVYESCPAGNNTTIACNDDACGLGSRVQFNPTPGAVYLVRVGGYNNQMGTGTLNISYSAPANDACGSATVVSSSSSTVGTLCGATGDGAAGCGASTGQPDVWFSYTAQCNGPVTFTTCGTHDGFTGPDTGVDPVLSVYSGGCGALTELACNDDSATCSEDAGIIRDSSVTVNLSFGTTYRIRVSRWGGSSLAGPVRLNVGPCGPSGCDADWCEDGSVGVPDIFCFLSDWFAMDPAARNFGGTPGVPAIFAFLSEWFSTGQGPCP